MWVATEIGMCGLCAAALPGCLIAEPPEFEEPRQTPPMLDLTRALPLVTEVVTIPADRGAQHQIEVQVPVRSEDLEDELFAQLVLNYLIKDKALTQGVGLVPPSTLSDTSRVIKIPWTVTAAVAPGCQQLTLLVTHLSNVDTENNNRPIDPADVAIATWWLNVEGTDGTSASMAQCPANTGGAL